MYKLYNDNGITAIVECNNDNQIITLTEFVDQVNSKLEQKSKLEKAIVFARQFFHLPQDVYDVFRSVVPGDEIDKSITRKEIDQMVSNECS